MPKLTTVLLGGWSPGSIPLRLSMRDTDEARAFKILVSAGLDAMKSANEFFSENGDDLDHANTILRLKDEIARNVVAPETNVPKIQRLQSAGPEIEQQASHILAQRCQVAWSLAGQVLKSALTLIPGERAEDLESEKLLLSSAGIPCHETWLVLRWDDFKSDLEQRIAWLNSGAGELAQRHGRPNPAAEIFELFII